jgi:curved DNA-binding protein CbpA|eukprot:TRINITY_DN55954_c0_g1_i1.p1 TRINITY_DN55954_c0_g1~~TRINITY_DN55954_c0_g1_i1.p1  ORF type:complete len:358 (-),score=65.12 TRINITY_DN55954_c0_g1_i1:335-1408(-)
MARAPDIKSDDFYRVLGVDRSASDSEIAKAYKKLALIHHPDKNQDNKQAAEENFKKITEAYEVLRDQDKRKSYDQFGKAGVQQGGGGGGGGVSFQQADQIFKAFFGSNDPFQAFFGGDDDDNPASAFFGSGRGGGGHRVIFRPGSSGGMGGGMPGGMPGMPGFGMDFGGGVPGMGGMPGKGHGRRSASDASLPPYAIPKGTEITVRGLAKAPEHNGRSGRVAGWDSAKGRYEVEIGDDSQSLSLRPRNVTQVCNVQLVGIESQPELNGQTGTILNYTDPRYSVRLRKKMENGRDVVGLQPANVILSKGTCVVVQGLVNEQFNGAMGQIKEIDSEAGRYTVECQNGRSIKIKFDNVLC